MRKRIVARQPGRRLWAVHFSRLFWRCAYRHNGSVLLIKARHDAAAAVGKPAGNVQVFHQHDLRPDFENKRLGGATAAGNDLAPI